jgi:hypothetical protein
VFLPTASNSSINIFLPTEQNHPNQQQQQQKHAAAAFLFTELNNIICCGIQCMFEFNKPTDISIR